ncbi:MAG: phosphoribosylanthranilate isomerase [Candidatus Omnitrophica bacterium]|nr:phosphoribosylanthranilate isomerase [Candidatus Omnitrophota bacterium]
MTLVKICGITNSRDADTAVKAGADALGFVFWRKSPRAIDLATAQGIIKDLPPSVCKVALFVDEDKERVRETISLMGVDTIQLHGNESPEYCDGFKGLRIIKAFRMKDEAVLDSIKKYKTDYLLLDAYVEGVPGGSGEQFNWDLAVRAKGCGKPIILAGGLNPGNIKEAIKRVDPFMVDVSSGVETAPGEKDPKLIEKFIKTVKGE